MFAGFHEDMIDIDGRNVFVRYKGTGEPLLLLHGFPQTHVMWHRIAARLAESFFVVCADLPGYGRSEAPPPSADHVAHSKRAMGTTLVEAMSRLGFGRCMVAGHDRGGRVAYRMALDHADRVLKIAVLDVVPTSEVLDRADARLATSFWPWSLLSQPAPLPERLLAADPEAVIDDAVSAWGSPAQAFPKEVRALYADALRNPASVRSICEEYRASVTVDAETDRRDRRAGCRISCPVLVLWSDGAVNDWYADVGGPLALWKQWAPYAHGERVSGGHFFPEANPDATHDLLCDFFLQG